MLFSTGMAKAGVTQQSELLKMNSFPVLHGGNCGHPLKQLAQHENLSYFRVKIHHIKIVNQDDVR